MAKPLKPLAAKNAAAANVVQKTGIANVAKPPRRPKGRMFAAAALSSKKFDDALANAVVKENVDLLRDLGIKSTSELKAILVRAHKLLDKAKVTVDDWQGRAFEIIGPKIPEVQYVERVIVDEIIVVANEIMAEGDTGFTFMNGLFEMAGVKKPFASAEVVYNTKIKEPGQAVGVDYSDRVHLLSNADGQKLPVSVEFKTRGAAGELKAQLAKRDDRIFGGEGHDVKSIADIDRLHAAREDTKLTYSIEGKPGVHETDLENIILLRSKDPTALPDNDMLTKIGIRAGKKFKVSSATDANGGRYIRVVAAVKTDALRGVIKRLLADKSWQ